MTIQEVAKQIADEVKTIEQGLRYESSSAAEQRADELWLLMKDFRSDVVFELIDHFRVVYFVLSRDDVEEEVLTSFLSLYDALDHRMTESHHRDYLFRKAFQYKNEI